MGLTRCSADRAGLGKTLQATSIIAGALIPLLPSSLLDDHRSDLLLFDALDIAKGPIATIQIPIRLRFGLHGNWANAADIGLVA